MTNLSYYITSFQTNNEVFKNILDVPSQLMSWKQSSDKWNLIEITCHLYDEEQEDFRPRLKSVLESPELPFPSIDPVGWVLSRNYAIQDFKIMIKKFSEERIISIEWLQSLKKVNWENTYHHPKIGPMSAKYILSNWLAHDFLHIRQITRIKYDYLKHFSGKDLSYAGEW